MESSVHPGADSMKVSTRATPKEGVMVALPDEGGLFIMIVTLAVDCLDTSLRTLAVSVKTYVTPGLSAEGGITRGYDTPVDTLPVNT